DRIVAAAAVEDVGQAVTSDGFILARAVDDLDIANDVVLGFERSERGDRPDRRAVDTRLAQGDGIFGSEDIDDIAPMSHRQGVVAEIAIDNIVAGFAFQKIVLVAALQGIVAVAADQEIGAAVAEQEVITVAARQRIGIEPAMDGVLAVAA